MKQAAIAVYAPDSAYEYFRKIINFMNQPPSDDENENESERKSEKNVNVNVNVDEC